MILISTLRKMVKKDPNARVARLVIKSHQTRMSGAAFNVPEVTEYFATDRQLNDRVITEGDILTLMGEDPAKILVADYVSAIDVAREQGFFFADERGSK